MNFFKGLMVLSLCSMTSMLSAMAGAQAPGEIIPQNQQDQAQQVQQNQRPSFISRYFPSSRAVRSCLRALIPSSKTVLIGVGTAALLSGASLMGGDNNASVRRMLQGASLLDSAVKAFESGYYVIDEETGKPCYYVKNKSRYDYLTTPVEQEDQGAQDDAQSVNENLVEKASNNPSSSAPVARHEPVTGWDPVHAGMFLATAVGSAKLFPKLVAAAGSFSVLHKAGTLMALGAAKPGCLGAAALFGVNLATVFGSMATAYALKKLVIKPFLKPLLIHSTRKLCSLFAPWPNSPFAAA